MIDSSWVIVNKETNEAVYETADFELCQFVNIKKYRVVPIHVWLASLNKGEKK